MIDFSKKIKKEVEMKKINPIDLYADLDRSSKTGPLRPVQERVLKEWYNNRSNDRDLIIKLHTGEGKTLIGLLILQSKINDGKGPCVYICPNKFLADQAFYEAKKFGIKVCLIEEDNSLPNEFLEGKAILLTSVQKLFNGKTIFGIDNHYKKVNTLVMDDAHACLDAIKQAYTITISRKKQSNVYENIMGLFESDLKDQGEGTFIDIKENADFESIMMVPYWAWTDKISEVVSILASETEKDYLKFTWPLIRDELEKCDAYMNGKEIQIIPHAFNVRRFGSFDKAQQRILMSATTQDDIFFVKNLDISIDAINNPVVCSDKKWSGEKMIIIPSIINDDLKREEVINYLCKFDWNRFGVCSLVPSFARRDDYKNLFCELLDSNNIFSEISRRQDGKYGKTLVIANRYDGIDLPDDACRILILDSLPFFGNMSDVYEEKGRVNCELIRRKIAQKIEQGLGRSVRGEKDYCCIVIVGADLVKFIMSVDTRAFFSAQTR
jgi:replicative superfamily II helicase